MAAAGTLVTDPQCFLVLPQLAQCMHLGMDSSWGRPDVARDSFGPGRGTLCMCLIQLDCIVPPEYRPWYVPPTNKNPATTQRPH